mgnify:CR=1 FL=1
MTSINTELELYSLKGNVTGGKILLFNRLENQNLNEDSIRELVVDEYQIMRPKHFVRSWKEYIKIKKFLSLEECIDE